MQRKKKMLLIATSTLDIAANSIGYLSGVPPYIQITMIVVFGLVVLFVAIWEMDKSDKEIEELKTENQKVLDFAKINELTQRHARMRYFYEHDLSSVASAKEVKQWFDINEIKVLISMNLIDLRMYPTILDESN